MDDFSLSFGKLQHSTQACTCVLRGSAGPPCRRALSAAAAAWLPALAPVSDTLLMWLGAASLSTMPPPSSISSSEASSSIAI